MARKKRPWRLGKKGKKPKDPRLWLYGRVPSGFWQEIGNQRLYLEWLGEQLGFTKPEDWYRVTSKDFLRRRGCTLLRQFNDSHFQLLKYFFPSYDWKEWLFVNTPLNFWKTPTNRRRYLDWLGEQLGFTKPEDWYRFRGQHLTDNYGSTLLSTRPGNSLLHLLQEYLPEYEWLEWQFVAVPDGFWDKRANRRRYLDWVGRQLGFTKPEDWYQVSYQDLEQRHGSRLLAKFGYSLLAVLKDYFPRYHWLEWRFMVVQGRFWDDATNRRRYLDWLGHKLGFRRPEDWYRLTTDHLLRHHAKGLAKRFRYSLIEILQEYLPEYEWLEWRFAKVPGGFWESPINRRRYLDWLRKQLGFTKPEDWYRIRARQVIDNYGGRLLTHRPGASLLHVLKEYLPEYEWLEWRFVAVPDGFWDDRDNRRRYLDWLSQQLGFTKPEDWYAISTQQLEKNHGSRLLAKFNGSILAILRDYRPDYDWKEWLFLRSPKSFWKQADNRRRYLDWLGTQLGYQRPEDWAGLRQADLFRHGGQRLLRKLHLQVSQIVDEYLGTQKRQP